MLSAMLLYGSILSQTSAAIKNTTHNRICTINYLLIQQNVSSPHLCLSRFLVYLLICAHVAKYFLFEAKCYDMHIRATHSYGNF